MNNAFQYAEKYGMESEASYPYLARDKPCRFKPNLVQVKISGY
jgi:hypothetical protein